MEGNNPLIDGSNIASDPLYLEPFVIHREDRCEAEFSPNLNGFLSLCHSEYITMAPIETNFAKAIPESVFTYYNIINCWDKLSVAERGAGRATRAMGRLISYIESTNPELNSGVATFFSGMGNFVDVLGTLHRLASSAFPNPAGHFRRIGADNHGLYESFPAPRIALYRILADIEERPAWWVNPDLEPCVVQEPGVNEEDPPRRARYDEDDTDDDVDAEHPEGDEEEVEVGAHHSHPTVNLLGWYPPARLTSNQRTVLASHFDQGESFVIPEFCLIDGLYQSVRNYVSTITRHKIEPMARTISGSLAQQLVIKPDDYFEFVTTIYYSDLVGVVSNHTEVNAVVVTAAKALCYRDLKTGIEANGGTVHPWACYSFNRYTEVPQAWIANRNTTVVRGLRAISLNLDYITASSSFVRTFDPRS